MKKYTFVLTALFVALTIFSPLYYNSQVSNSARLETQPVGSTITNNSILPNNAREVSIQSADSVYVFSADQLEKVLNMSCGSLEGITVTLSSEYATLSIEGRAVEPLEYIPRAQIDSLRCNMGGEAVATIEILPNSQSTATLPAMVNLRYNSEVSPIKPVLKPQHIYALQNINVVGALQAYNIPLETGVTYILRAAPEKGMLSIQGESYIYAPYVGASGSDSVTVCAVDSFGNCSEDTVFEITIEELGNAVTFSDMVGSPHHYSAIKLRQSGVINGEQVGGEWFFHPAREVTNGEFIVMILSALGEDKNLESVTTTQLNKDYEIPMWMKPYVAKAIKLGIIKEKTFDVNDVPMRAEAVLLIDRALRKQTVQHFNLMLADLGEIPAWALPSYMKLAKHGMLALYDNYAYPRKPLTRGYAADLVWQLYRNVM